LEKSGFYPDAAVTPANTIRSSIIVYPWPTTAKIYYPSSTKGSFEGRNYEFCERTKRKLERHYQKSYL
jgi:hypothetical protein